jgi:hypothetical protein
LCLIAQYKLPAVLNAQQSARKTRRRAARESRKNLADQDMHEITTIIQEYMKDHGPLQTALFMETVLEKAFGNKYRIKAFANGTYIVEQSKEQSKDRGLKNT